MNPPRNIPEDTCERYYDYLRSLSDLVVLMSNPRLICMDEQNAARALGIARRGYVLQNGLTATPIQNNMMEFFGLLSFIDSQAFGDESSFKLQYLRLAEEGKFEELRSRIAPFCHRTLRRQVAEYIRYTKRICFTQAFEPGEDVDGLEEDIEEWESDEPEVKPDAARLKVEIEELKGFRDRARAIRDNAKGLKLLTALERGFAELDRLGAEQKAIIFTESGKTQAYLFGILAKTSYKDSIVLFNGTNTDPGSKAIYREWLDERKGSDQVSGSQGEDHDRHRGRR